MKPRKTQKREKAIQTAAENEIMVVTLETLNDHLFILQQLQAAEERLYHMRAVILGAQTYEGMPHGTGVYDKVSALAIAIANQEAEVHKLRKAVNESRQKIEPFVSHIPDNRCKVIFDLRFLCGLPWEEVAAAMGGKNTSDTVRMAAYRYLQATQAAQFYQ